MQNLFVMLNFQKKLKQLIPDEQYKNARMVEDQEAWDETAKTLGARWQEEVIAYAK